MEFRTKVEIPPSNLKIDYQSNILFIGSCFADNIGSKLKNLKFLVEHNPFGVLYNPISINNNLEILLEKKLFSDPDLYWFNNKWISFSHFSAFSNANKEKCLEKINASILSASKLLAKAKFLFITFGTSWVYEFVETGKIVANCHKIPANKFRRFLLNINDIVNAYRHLIQIIRKINFHCEIIFTVSPIRHWKDGAIQNQVSKSILILAIQELLKEFDNTGYFPAYEIFMDELRDYRFYANDMLHPSDFALEYTWQRFSETYISNNTRPVIKDIEKLINAWKHSPINPGSRDYKAFLKKQLEIIETLEIKYPFLDFNSEKQFFQSK
jgi:hypothetical protein